MSEQMQPDPESMTIKLSALSPSLPLLLFCPAKNAKPAHWERARIEEKKRRQKERKNSMGVEKVRVLSEGHEVLF